ncbi:tail assembly chaperone [Microbacterium phage Megan]|uniref:Tail assembly chaperone n=1 Tax=Microbacterium phage Megan TaxID=2656551 RepID=A0A649VK58_9CAUD|nr:tail assembly chaperone [Microbacterium phage Megan]QGJ92698.1 tail assembly chaperone [Microbacterium phage Megan]
MADTETPPVQPARRVVTTRKKAPQDRQAPKPTKAQAAATPIIDIDSDDTDIPVRLVGIDYVAHRPKAMLAIRLGERVNAQSLDMNDLPALIDTMGEFMRLIFGTDTAAAIMARLEDPDDRIDLAHIQRLVNRMVEVTTGRPPTSPSASRA